MTTLCMRIIPKCNILDHFTLQTLAGIFRSELHCLWAPLAPFTAEFLAFVPVFGAKLMRKCVSVSKSVFVRA